MACSKLRVLAWLLMFTFFCGFVLFFVSYIGRDWYVVPNERAVYPPVSSSTYAPDNPKRPIKFGLFWMCVGLHCKYDLRVDYMIVMYLPYAGESDDVFHNQLHHHHQHQIHHLKISHRHHQKTHNKEKNLGLGWIWRTFLGY